MLDALDKRIVSLLQEDLPLTPSPFDTLARALGISEETLLKRLENLQAEGALRRIGAVLHHRKSGVAANAMVVWQLPEEAVEAAGRRLAQESDISHCYRRESDDPEWPYTLFTMLHGVSEAACEARIDALAKEIGALGYEVLYSTRELKKASMRYFTEE